MPKRYLVFPPGRILGREPAVLVGAIVAVLSIFVAFGVPWLTAEQAGLIEAFVSAVAYAWLALKLRPIAPTVFTGVITTGAALAAAYGLDLTQEQIGSITAAVTAVMTALVVRPRSQPRPPKASPDEDDES